VNLYGRRIRDGEVNHLYLPGKKQGVFNGANIKSADQIILVESIIDALALIQAGYSGAVPCFGTSGIPADVLTLIKQFSEKQLILCFDSDDAGRNAAGKAKTTLTENGIRSRLVMLPEGFDPCSFLHQSAGKSEFRQLIQNGKIRMGGKKFMGAGKSSQPVKISREYGILKLTYNSREYELKGINIESTKCRVTIKVTVNGENPDAQKNCQTGQFHLDTIDLYSAKSRANFSRAVAELFNDQDNVVSAELLAMIEPIDKYKEDRNKEPEADAKPNMTESERKAAMLFLMAPDIFTRILDDFETVGFTGEKINKLVGYLAAVSRKLEDPISVCIQSRSAAGKSALQDAILGMVPEEDLVRYTRLTGQALFYKEGDSLEHKIIAIEEALGADAALYAIRTLLSSNELTVGSAGRDVSSGKMQTDENKVKGPTSVFMTTTAPDIESETATRFAFLTMDESSEATAKIHAAQRFSKTLEGLRARKRKDIVTRLHQNAQRLLETGLKVVIPFAEHLEFPTENLRTRRDNMRYLSLIEAIAFLHQYQREIKIDDVDGKQDRYIEATVADLELANKLAIEFLGRSLDELSPPSRKLLNGIHEMVMSHSKKQGISAHEYTFTRRDIRKYMYWTDFQVKTHIHQLVDLEYIYFISGRKGKEYIYELKYDGEMNSAKKYLPGLITVEELLKKLKESGCDPDLEGEN
jgi:DNA primase